MISKVKSCNITFAIFLHILNHFSIWLETLGLVPNNLCVEMNLTHIPFSKFHFFLFFFSEEEEKSELEKLQDEICPSLSYEQVTNFLEDAWTTAVGVPTSIFFCIRNFSQALLVEFTRLKLEC